jgi:hypothetical protein
MSVRYDDKGKYFTEIVSKYTISATIQTLLHRIHGNLHLRMGERLKDEMDRAGFYLPITDVTIYSMQGQVLYNADFLLISREQIIWIMPEEPEQDVELPGGDA